jgi:hypothetical protein
MLSRCSGPEFIFRIRKIAARVSSAATGCGTTETGFAGLGVFISFDAILGSSIDQRVPRVITD